MVTDKEQIEQALEAQGKTKEQADAIIAGMEQAQAATDGLTDSFSFLDQVIGQTGLSLKNLGAMTAEQSVKFALVATAIAGATTKFEHFNQTISGGPIGTFQESFGKLIETVKQSPVASIASGAFSKLYQSLLALGGPTDKLQAAWAKGPAALAAYGQALVTNADNSIKLGAGMLKAVASAGDLDDFITKSSDSITALGEDFHGLGAATSQYGNILTASMRDTGIQNIDLMSKFGDEILKTKGGMKDLADGMVFAGEKTNALTALVKIAHGTQLDVTQTLQDARTAATDYGVGINASTQMIARYIDVQKATGARQEDVRDAILKTLGAFRSYTMSGTDATKMTSGLTDSVKNWAKALEAAGVPTKQAMELGAQYTAQLKDMDEAQESFVSQATGGPGGLAGSFEFEDLIRQGKSQEASAKVAEAMRQQMRSMGGSGEILTREQARTMGAEGKEQFERQRMMMMSGILGVKPKSREEAEQMMAALSKGGDIFGKVTEATGPGGTEEAAQQAVARATAQEGMSFDAVKEANITAEEVRLQAGNILATTAQNALSANAQGTSPTGRGINVEGRESLIARQRAGGTNAPGTEQTMNNLAGTMRNMSVAIPSALRSFKEAVTPEQDINQVMAEAGMSPERLSSMMTSALNDQMRAQGFQGGLITKEEALAGKGGGAEQYAQERQMVQSGMFGRNVSAEEADRMIEAMRSGNNLPGLGGDTTAGTTGPGVLPGLPGMGPRAGGDVASRTIGGLNNAPAATQVGRVIPGLNRGGEAPGTTTGAGRGVIGGITPAAGGPIPVTLANGAQITVNLTGACPHCGRGTSTTQQSTLTSASSTSTHRGTGP